MVAARRRRILVDGELFADLQEQGVVHVELLAAGERGIGLLLLDEVAERYHGLVQAVLGEDAGGAALHAEALDPHRTAFAAQVLESDAVRGSGHAEDELDHRLLVMRAEAAARR